MHFQRRKNFAKLPARKVIRQFHSQPLRLFDGRKKCVHIRASLSSYFIKSQYQSRPAASFSGLILRLQVYDEWNGRNRTRTRRMNAKQQGFRVSLLDWDPAWHTREGFLGFLFDPTYGRPNLATGKADFARP